MAFQLPLSQTPLTFRSLTDCPQGLVLEGQLTVAQRLSFGRTFGSSTRGQQDVVPEGQLVIAQRFSAGMTPAPEPSPEGTVECVGSLGGVSRPCGTNIDAALNPTLKRWATLRRPFGTEMPSSSRKSLKPGLLVLSLCVSFGLPTRADQTNQEACAAPSLVISTAKPLPVKEKVLREAVYSLCQEMLNAPAGKFPAHPSAAVFPGPVAKDAPRISRTLKLKHAPPPPDMMPLIKPLDYSSPFAPTLYLDRFVCCTGRSHHGANPWAISREARGADRLSQR